MNELLNFDDVNKRIITLRNQSVILDFDVAKIYGVQTKEVNQAIKNNPKKFPEGYVFPLKLNEFERLLLSASSSKQPDNQELVKNFDQSLTISNLERAKHAQMLPKAFTEKGLYMLATILKSDRAIDATLEIVEAFAKMRELSRNIAMLSTIEPEVIEPEIIEKTGSLLDDLLFSHLPTTSSETSFEFNLGVLKGKKTVKSDNSALQRQVEQLEKTIEKMSGQLAKLTGG